MAITFYSWIVFHRKLQSKPYQCSEIRFSTEQDALDYATQLVNRPDHADYAVTVVKVRNVQDIIFRG